jgi:para-aminobenzoate synthetase/4-amino-4-deoxychorismate lyase
MARRAHPDADDVILSNERGEITEATLANVVAEIDGVRYTPPLACGLLGGTFRAELLESGRIRERVLTRRDVAGASRVWVINSVREWIEAVLV